MNPSRWIEERFYPSDGETDLLRERLHYENLKSLTDKQLDVVRYLYMRLNIIDCKASYLLRINTLTASVISLLVSFSAKTDESILHALTAWQIVALALTMVFIVVGFVLTYAIGELDYDRVTAAPAWFNQVELAGYDDSRYMDTRNAPVLAMRRFQANYSVDEAREIIDLLRSSAATLDRRGYGVHTFKQYEDLFFKITIARVRILRWARGAIGIAVLMSLVFVFSLAVYPPSVPKGAPTTMAVATTAARAGLPAP